MRNKKQDQVKIMGIFTKQKKSYELLLATMLGK